MTAHALPRVNISFWAPAMQVHQDQFLDKLQVERDRGITVKVMALACNGLGLVHGRQPEHYFACAAALHSLFVGEHFR